MDDGTQRVGDVGEAARLRAKGRSINVRAAAVALIGTALAMAVPPM